jgi:hypothetical protein
MGGIKMKDSSGHSGGALPEKTGGAIPISIDAPATFSFKGPVCSESNIQHLLPLQWSLYYALPKKQWGLLRERHKVLHPDWERCACPKRCKASTLDECWKYDYATHTKIFLGAEFICRGCHWLKSLPWRMQMWDKQQSGMLPVSSTPHHIIDCLGWTQERVDTLREKDLKQHQREVVQLNHLKQQIDAGKAAVAQSPIDHLSPQELEALVKPGQAMIVPWKVDLSALSAYGYSSEEVVLYEQRMYQLAAKQMSWQ